MIDLEEIRTKLVQDYRQLWINKHRFELNDDEVDMEDCNSKLGYIVELLMFITGWSREAVGESLASHINYQIILDPQDNPKEWDLNKFDYVEAVENIPYCSVDDFPFDDGQDDYSLEREGFIIDHNPGNEKEDWVYIPAGTIMRFDGADCNGWPEFTLRMKFNNIQLDFAGDPFKVKLV